MEKKPKMRKLSKDGRIVSRSNNGVVLCVNPTCSRFNVPTPRDDAASVNIRTAGLENIFSILISILISIN